MDDLFQRINQLLTNADEQMTLWDLLISHLITYCNAISSGLQRQESIATSNFGQASSMNNIHFLLSLQQHSSIQALCKQSQSILYKIYKVQAAIENQNKQAEIALSQFFDKICPNFEDQLDMYSSELSYKVNLLKQLARDYKLQYLNTQELVNQIFTSSNEGRQSIIEEIEMQKIISSSKNSMIILGIN